MKIVTVLGTRPEIIKMSPLIPHFDRMGEHIVIHSGQHYSAEMDTVFFRDLELRAPDRYLRVGSIPPAAQVGAIAAGVEQVITETLPDWVVVHGDTNTTLGGALAAAKHRHQGLRLAHVEAGARSFNDLQPEELNRVLIDRMSDALFAPTQDDAENLMAEGIDSARIFVTGNTIVESCARMASIVASEPALYEGAYAVATIHRQESVDDPRTLDRVWAALERVAARIPVVLPLHPRTRKALPVGALDSVPEGLVVREPLGYRDMTRLLMGASFCLTDSGGVQEEAAILHIPTLVVREETEHRRYVGCGIHSLVGYEPDRIVGEALALLNPDERARRSSAIVPLDSNVSDRIVNELSR